MAEKLPDIVIKNALLSGGKTDIEITDGIITRLGTSEKKGACCTLDGAGLSVEAGQIFFCGNSFSFNGEELLFSGYSTVIFRQTALSPPVSELFKTVMNTPLNFAVISACKRSEEPYDDGTLTLAEADLIPGHIGSLVAGMAAGYIGQKLRGERRITAIV